VEWWGRLRTSDEVLYFCGEVLGWGVGGEGERASGEGGEGFDEEGDLTLDALGTDGLEEREVFAKGAPKTVHGGVTDCIPMMIKGVAADGVLAVGDGGPLVQFFCDTVDFDAAVIRTLINKLPDYVLPCTVGAVGGGGMEVDHGKFAAEVGADDEHVAGKDAEVWGEGGDQGRRLGIVGGAPLVEISGPVSTEGPGGGVD